MYVFFRYVFNNIFENFWKIYIDEQYKTDK